MRIFTILPSKRASRIAAMFMLSTFTLLFSSCSKDEETAVAISGLMIVNASPSSGTYNLYWGTTKVNAAALPFLGSVPYVQIAPGTHTFKFTTANSVDPVLTKDITLAADKPYSLFLINDIPQLEGLLIEDDLTPSSTDKAYIRFINLSPDAPSLDLVQAGGASLITDKAFKSVSAFTITEAKSYSFEVKNKLTGEVIATLKDVSLAAGKLYTIAACGYVKPANLQQPAGIQVFTNR
jgi:hypothetical protein